MLGKLYDWALIYRDMGLCPIPLYRRNDPRDDSGNKRPMFANWQKACMPDDVTLARWFCDDRRNIGILCGLVSGNLIVVDFDDFGAYITWLENVDPPSTLTMNTAHGVHCYYRVTDDVPGNRKLIGGDLRGQGGQVVAPPSVHISGKVYEVRDASPIAVTTVSALQLPWHVRAELSVPARQAVLTGDYTAIVQALATAPVGDRNNTLLWCACRLFDQDMSQAQVESLLLVTALQVGLSQRETKLTIANARKQSRKAHPPLPAHKLFAARLERHGNRNRQTIRV